MAVPRSGTEAPASTSWGFNRERGHDGNRSFTGGEAPAGFEPGFFAHWRPWPLGPVRAGHPTKMTESSPPEELGT